jgi:hypothetical protein
VKPPTSANIVPTVSPTKEKNAPKGVNDIVKRNRSPRIIENIPNLNIRGLILTFFRFGYI